MSPPTSSPKIEVSVLMSCYNASRWLPQAIESVLGQTLAAFELILVDDGSTDDTRNILERYCDRDPRIATLFKTNTGLADSLNRGIATARGPWIARLDADDLCEPTRLEQQLQFVRNHEVVLLGAGAFEIDAHNRIITKHSYSSGHLQMVRGLERLQRFFPHSSAFFRRTFAQDMGCYNPLFRKAQDRDLWLRFAERGRIACLQNRLVRVRKHPAQISNSASGFSQIVYGTAATVCHFLRGQGSYDPSSSAGIALWPEFIQWVDTRVGDEDICQRLKAWGDARDEYFGTRSGLNAPIQLGARLLKSGYVNAVLREKLFGSSLAKRLAREWTRKIAA